MGTPRMMGFDFNPTTQMGVLQIGFWRCSAADVEGICKLQNKHIRITQATDEGIDRVIFNPPATIVFWEDGTKTVVKCENEPFDAEKGFAMAVAKKFLTSKDYHRIMASAKDYRESVCIDNAGQTRRKDE